jgi:hypothetical protein
MIKTRSEHLFERFCRENSLRFSRVLTEIDTKTPDYDVFPRENRVVVEIKELQANDNDETAHNEARAHGAAAAWSDPRNRIRRKIGAAAKQLKCRCEGLYPAIVMLFDNGTFGGIDVTDVKNAMYGDETVLVTRFPSGDTAIVTRLGGGRTCTPTDNRSLSAVALLWTTGEAVHLSIFHNIFARRHLPYDWFASDACHQYSIVLDRRGVSGFPEWHRV